MLNTTAVTSVVQLASMACADWARHAQMTQETGLVRQRRSGIIRCVTEMQTLTGEWITRSLLIGLTLRNRKVECLGAGGNNEVTTWMETGYRGQHQVPGHHTWSVLHHTAEDLDTADVASTSIGPDTGTHAVTGTGSQELLQTLIYLPTRNISSSQLET